MIAIPPSWIFTGVVVLAAGGYALHCEHAKKELHQSAAVAEQQARANALQAHRDLRSKEIADENYKHRIARLAADRQRLRNTRPDLLPTTTTDAGGDQPALACYRWRELSLALRHFEAGVDALLGEGDAALIAIDEVRRMSEATRPP